MYTDGQNLFSDEQTVSSTGTASTNVIDLGVDRNVGQGEPLAAVFVTTSCESGTDETYEFQVQTDSAVGFDSSLRVIGSRAYTNAEAVAELTAGSRLVIPLGHDNERYLRINYVMAGTAEEWVGTAFLVPMSMIPAEEKYADGFTIS